MRFLQPLAAPQAIFILNVTGWGNRSTRGDDAFAFFASLRVSKSAFWVHAKVREEREGGRMASSDATTGRYAESGGGVMVDVEECARLAIDSGLQIHRSLGPGLLESVYEAVLEASLIRLGLAVQRQKLIDIEYDGMLMREGFRADLFVGGGLTIEVKSVERFAPVHGKQLLTYLRLTRQPLGLLMNFGAGTFREGLKRVVNNHCNIESSTLRVNRREAGSA